MLDCAEEEMGISRCLSSGVQEKREAASEVASMIVSLHLFTV